MPESTPELSEASEAARARQYFADLFGEFKKRASNNPEGPPEPKLIFEAIEGAFQRSQIGIAVFESSMDIEDKKVPQRVIQINEKVPPRYIVAVTERELKRTDLGKLGRKEKELRMIRFVQNIRQIVNQATAQTRIIQ